MISSMKAVIGIVLLMLSSALSDMAGECDMAIFYLELGCQPEMTAVNGSCPLSFKCPKLHPDPNMCYYRGVAYEDKASIPQNLVTNPCSQACSCNVYNGKPEFQCAAVDCFEVFDGDLSEQCISTYEIDSCCSTGNVCGKDAIANLKTCEVDGKTYREGEMFEPLKTKKACVCTPEWNGSIDNPLTCRDIDCGVEIHFQTSILNMCAPVFSGNLRSCPIGFECPTAATKLIRGLNIENLATQCTYGNMTLSIGDEVTVKDLCTKCTCELPPFVTCVRKNSCDL